MTAPPLPEHKCRPRAVLLALDRPDIVETLRGLRPMIERYCEVLLEDVGFTADLSQVAPELAIVFGGDGSILRAAHQMGVRQVPVIGVNLGKLGFLADLLPDELEGVLQEVCEVQHHVVSHLMFNARVLRGERVVHEQLGLNEATVLAGQPFRMVEIQLYVDAELATIYSCDGLIIGTPVGSTAHSLSAGGPILRKDLQAFVILPINPHTLTNRPVVDSALRRYELVVPHPNEGTTLVVDGWPLCSLTAEDRVEITRAEPCFQLVESAGHTYYRTLREKLGWGGRLKNNH